MLRTTRRVVTVLALATAFAARGSAADLPGVGEPVIDHDIRVTMLSATRLSVDECREALGAELMLWSGGGLRLAFLVENRPGASTPPAIGDVRVIVDQHAYNDETDPGAGKPFAPIAMRRSVGQFTATAYGREQKARIPAPRPDTAAAVIELFVRGGPIPRGATAIVELEGPGGVTFRFQLPPLQ
jgi:hypothetical protein